MAPRTPSPLLSVLLVTSSSRGSVITFQYPRRPKIEKRYSRVRYHIDEEDNDKDDQQFRLHEDEMDEEFEGEVELSDDEDETEESESDASDGQDLDEERSEYEAGLSRREIEVASSAGGTGNGGKESAAASNQRAKRLKAYQQYLGYDTQLLASILAPKRELCHRKFELVIDDLAFIGHPVCVDKNGNWDPDSQHQQQGRGRDQKKRGEVGGYTIGSPPPEEQTAKKTQDSSSQSPMTMFHFVLVLDRPDPSPHLPLLDLTSWLQIFYDNIAFKMTAALFAEEIRYEYVTKESEKLGVLRDRCMDDAQSYASFLTHSLHTSSLARSLQQVYSSISLSSNAFVTINDSIDAHLQLPPILHDPTRMMRIADVETPIDANDAVYSRGPAAGPVNIDDLIQEEWTRTTGPFLLPWKTLLLLNNGEDEGDIADDLENLSSLGMAAEQGIEAWAKKFTSLLKPTLEGIPTFAELADLLDWSLDDDVYPMVRHLIYYREARVVDVPRIQNYYAISPLFDLSDLPKLSTSWSIRFPTLPPLAAFLATLSSVLKPFSVQLSRKDQRNLCLEALIWLLRHQVIVQMHVRLRLIAGEEAKRKAAKARRVERIRIEESRHKRITRLADRERKKQAMEALTSSNSQLSEISRSAPADVVGAGERYERGRSRDRSMSPSQKDETADDQQQQLHDALTFSSALSATRPDQSHLRSSSRNPASTPSSYSNTIPMPIPLPDQIEELKFERRPVLRSRSPSKMLVIASERGSRSISTRGSGSRPSTPRRGRVTAHSREPSGSLAADLFLQESLGGQQHQLQQPKSVPASATNQSQSQARVSRPSRHEINKQNTSRSPSRARMRITGFGEGEEVYVETGSTSQDSTLQSKAADEDRRLSLVGEEGEGGDAAAAASKAKKVEQSNASTTADECHNDGSHDSQSIGEEDDDDDDDKDYLVEEEDIEVEAWELNPQSSIITEPSRAGRKENEWIAAIVEDRPQWLAQRLFKLLPFLNGKHTIDEIVYRLDWRRKDLRAVLVAFKDEILTLVHP